jgi:hypothetical protein
MRICGAIINCEIRQLFIPIGLTIAFFAMEDSNHGDAAAFIVFGTIKSGENR